MAQGGRIRGSVGGLEARGGPRAWRHARTLIRASIDLHRNLFRRWIAGSSPGNDGSKRFPGDCRIASRIVRGGGTVACRFKRQLAAGPVAQWVEPAPHNGLVAGSSPARPPLFINPPPPQTSPPLPHTIHKYLLFRAVS